MLVSQINVSGTTKELRFSAPFRRAITAAGRVFKTFNMSVAREATGFSNNRPKPKYNKKYSVMFPYLPQLNIT